MQWETTQSSEKPPWKLENILNNQTTINQNLVLHGGKFSVCRVDLEGKGRHQWFKNTS